jgi:hypothetical protein
MPHTSLSGAKPGERKGWYFQMSWSVISVAFLFAVQYFFASVGLNGALRVALQWSQFATRCPCESLKHRQVTSRMVRVNIAHGASMGWLFLV